MKMKARTNITIGERLLHAIREHAAANETTISEIIARAARAYPPVRARIADDAENEPEAADAGQD